MGIGWRIPQEADIQLPIPERRQLDGRRHFRQIGLNARITVIEAREYPGKDGVHTGPGIPDAQFTFHSIRDQPDFMGYIL